MPSQKQSKRRRKAAQAPPPPVRMKTQRRQASPRVLIAAGAAVAVIVIAVVLGVVLTGGSGGSSAANAPKLPDAVDVQQLLAGVPQHASVLGKPSAPATMVEYVDLQCPFCQQFETQAMPTLISRYVRNGKLKVEARIIAFIGGDSQRGRLAALAAGQQNKQFNFMQLLYDNQGTENTGWLSDDMVKSAAVSIPTLDVNRLLSERNSSAVDAQAKTFDAQASTDGVISTPTILVGKSAATAKRVTLSSPTDEASVAAAINAALR